MFRCSANAASDMIMAVLGGDTASAWGCFLFFRFSSLCPSFYSLASTIVVVSSGVAEKPLNTNRFLAFQKAHIVQGNSDPARIPAGGRHFFPHHATQVCYQFYRSSALQLINKGSKAPSFLFKRTVEGSILINKHIN